MAGFEVITEGLGQVRFLIMYPLPAIVAVIGSRGTPIAGARIPSSLPSSAARRR
jgi:hypothetical protein